MYVTPRCSRRWGERFVDKRLRYPSNRAGINSTLNAAGFRQIGCATSEGAEVLAFELLR